MAMALWIAKRWTPCDAALKVAVAPEVPVVRAVQVGREHQVVRVVPTVRVAPVRPAMQIDRRLRSALSRLEIRVPLALPVQRWFESTSAGTGAASGTQPETQAVTQH